jgi:hypothetical protein
MPLENIDAEWLDIMLFNGLINPLYEDQDVGSSVLVTEALREAPEASREQIAAMIEIAAPQLLVMMQTGRLVEIDKAGRIKKVLARGLPADNIAEVMGVIRAAVLELRADTDWSRRISGPA